MYGLCSKEQEIRIERNDAERFFFFFLCQVQDDKVMEGFGRGGGGEERMAMVG